MTGVRTLSADERDEALMRRVQADDQDAFGALYDRFGTKAFRVALAVARDRPRAEDIVQEAFLTVWRSRAAYRPERGTVVGWVMTTVRNRAIDSLRRNSRHESWRAPGGDLDIDERLAAPGSVEETVGERDQAARLRLTLARLPAAQRDVIALAYFGELSTSEIARQLSLQLGTVKGRMRLGLDKLRADGPS